MMVLEATLSLIWNGKMLNTGICMIWTLYRVWRYVTLRMSQQMCQSWGVIIEGFLGLLLGISSYLRLSLAISCFFGWFLVIYCNLELYWAILGILGLSPAIFGYFRHSGAISGYFYQLSSIRVQVEAGGSTLLLLQTFLWFSPPQVISRGGPAPKTKKLGI